MYYIYKLTGPTNKSYIGITNNLTKRMSSHRTGKSKCSYFVNAIKKYGWDQFKLMILFEGSSEPEALQKEKDFIEKYKTTDRQFGYNLKDGGTRPYFTKAAKLKMRQNHADVRGKKNPFYGKAHTEETRKLISQRVIESGNKTWLGKKLSPEHKEKLRLAKLGNKNRLGGNKYLKSLTANA